MTIQEVWQQHIDSVGEEIAEAFDTISPEELTKLIEMQKAIFYFGATAALHVVAEDPNKKTAVASLMLTLSMELGLDGAETLQ